MKKIKGTLAKPEPQLLIAISALSLCVLLPMRVYQASVLIDSTTGFFSRGSFTIPLFYILAAAVVLFTLVASFLNSKVNRTRNCITVSKPLAVVSLLAGLAVMYDAFAQMLRFIQISAEYTDITVTKMSYLTKSGATALLLGSAFAVFSAFFFFVYAASCFNKNIKMSSFRLLSIAPVAWEICRIIFRFVRKISFVNVSDLLLELFMLVFMISFMLALAQAATNVTPEISAWRLYGCGLPAALLAFITSVPRLLLIVIGHSDMLVDKYGFFPCDLVIAIFIPMFLYYTATAQKKNTK